MALYIAKVEVPPNTPENYPIEKKVQLRGKQLSKIEYRFPAGVFESVKCRVTYGNLVLSPKGPYKWVDGEDEKVTDEIEWKLPYSRTTVTIQAWSEAEDYPHTITIRFHVKKELPTEIFERIEWWIRGVAERIKALLGF